MAIDPMMLNPLLDTFRNMVKDCREKNLSGENFDQMCSVLARMEQLGNELSDFNEFNACMAQENLYGKFSDYYGRVLSGAAQAEVQSGSYDDSALLKSTIDALKNAIIALRDGYETAMAEATKHGNAYEIEVLQNPAPLIQPIEDLIALGEQEGMTLPDFLRIQIERGLDKATEGTVVSRKGMEFEKGYTDANPVSPYHINMIDEKLKAFDKMCADAAFGVPVAKEWNLKRDDIDRKYVSDIERFRKIIALWERMLDDLSHWSLSYTSFAPYIDPWKMAKNPREAVVETQNVHPGVFVNREAMLKKYFNIGFYDIFSHPSFMWQVKYDFISESQEFVEFLALKIYPQCKPFHHLPADLIAERGDFSMFGPKKQDRESNPQMYMIGERMKEFYDNTFGSGRYEQRFGKTERNNSLAAPWKRDFRIGG
jgi:hypothetical protein